MKFIAIIYILVSAFASPFAEPGDEILGIWYSAERAKIEMFKANNRYHGRIVDGKKALKKDGSLQLDVNNPDEKLRTRPLKGLTIFSNFVYEDSEYSSGKVYDPTSGKTYNCEMKLKDGKLEIRGYLGISIFGKTTTWTRE